MKTKSGIFLVLVPVVAIVLADEWIKFIALKRLPEEGSLLSPGIIDFAIHKNFGIAFDIPFKISIIIVVSLIIGAFLLHIVHKNWRKHPDIATACFLIIIGALGNLYDRIVYAFTVDYIILLGRLAINLSDIVILSGVIWLLMASQRSKSHHLIHPDEPKY